MKKEPLVSIVTPCYNGERFLDSYFNDLLEQDYPYCEVIFMDDGSTDGSAKKAEFYKDALQKKGYQLKYYRHENMGTGGTINEGIKHVTGSFLIWPDCDDRMTRSCISRKVAFLTEHADCGIVRTNGTVVEETGGIIGDIVRDSSGADEPWQFENYLFGNNAWLQPGSFMVRMSAFDECNPDRYVYPSRRGQNWQMVLPVMYRYKCGYIDECLFRYVVHEDSLSRAGSKDYTAERERLNQYEDIIINTLFHMSSNSIMPEPEMWSYIERIKAYYIRKKITCAFLFDQRQDAGKLYADLRKTGRHDWKSLAKVMLTGIPFSKDLFRFAVGVR